MHVVLALLDGELHGYALMRRVEEGTMYGTINRLLADGLIEETMGVLYGIVYVTNRQGT